MSQVADFEVRQEDDLVASRSVVKVAVVGLLTGALGVLCAGVILVASTGSLKPSFAGPKGERPAESQISQVEQTPIRDARRGLDLREVQKRELLRWSWVDRKAGRATIPIETAIDVVIEESR
jgi:hypothetical protein